MSDLQDSLHRELGIVADDEDDQVHFHTKYAHDLASSSISSLLETAHDPASDPFDFSVYMDQVCTFAVAHYESTDVFDRPH